MSSSGSWAAVVAEAAAPFASPVVPVVEGGSAVSPFGWAELVAASLAPDTAATGEPASVCDVDSTG
jgi:hypothetical protein